MAARQDMPQFGSRLLAAKFFVCFLLSLLGLRLYFLQAVSGEYYRDLSENNRLRTIRREAARGLVLDRKGRLLVRNRPSFNIALLKEDIPDIEQTLRSLHLLLDADIDSMRAEMKRARTRQPFQPMIVLPDVSREVVAEVKVHSSALPGVIVQTKPVRSYPYDGLAAQTLGFTREISARQLARHSDEYKSGDSLGQSGLEQSYEEELRGDAGFLQVEVDARGLRRSESELLSDRQGETLQLTLDAELQLEAEEALGDRKGALVAMDPRDGSILALASTPHFDANTLAGRVLQKEWRALTKDEKKPLENRAIAHIYPPGSTMKLISAAAGLNEEVITEDTRFYCPGYFRLGRRRYRCHKHGGHGRVNLREAVRMSCNVYFYHLGQALGIDRISHYLAMFGFGQKSGIDIPKEEAGVKPSKEWKKKTVGEKWYPGDTPPVAIGQGYIAVTPIQLASAVSALANGGTLYKPHLLRRVFSQSGKAIYEAPPQLVRRLPIESEHLATVREYAAEVVNHRRGTGQRARLLSVPVGGKTGTAQVVRGVGKREREEDIDHAVFVAFAPVENPEIVISVIVENAGGGGRNAAPVARSVLRKYFRSRGVLSEQDWQIVDTGPDGGVIPPLEAREVEAASELKDSAMDESRLDSPLGFRLRGLLDEY